MARKTGLVADPFVLERIRPTPSQGKLGRKDRDKNVRGAFQVRLQQKTPIAGKRILLIDDVLTTGATASACARELKKAGASEVGVLVFARVGAIR
ncbi:MAG: ComF family protein [Alphaproteobacteria bacterium]|nr:ComF family protein [Alphaproteobacteria bacterium]